MVLALDDESILCIVWVCPTLAIVARSSQNYISVMAASAEDVDIALVAEETRPKLTSQCRGFAPRNALVVRNEDFGNCRLELFGLWAEVVVAHHIATIWQNADTWRTEVFALRCGAMVYDSAW